MNTCIFWFKIFIFCLFQKVYLLLKTSFFRKIMKIDSKNNIFKKRFFSQNYFWNNRNNFETWFEIFHQKYFFKNIFICTKLSKVFLKHYYFLSYRLLLTKYSSKAYYAPHHALVMEHKCPPLGRVKWSVTVEYHITFKSEKSILKKALYIEKINFNKIYFYLIFS